MTFTHALLFPKPHAPEAKKAAAQLTEELQGAGIQTQAIWDLSATLPAVPEKTTLAIILGGDGTFLLTTNALHGKNIPITGVNLGNLGFLAEGSAKNLIKHLSDVLEKQTHQEERPYYIAELSLPNGETHTAPFINDAVLHRESSGKMVHFTLHAMDKLMTSTRADGLIISTPTGSTAYNLSTGGPIVHPETEALILSPICPHALSFRPVVVPPKEVRLILEDNAATLSLDGQLWHRITPGAELTVRQSEYRFTILHTTQPHFFRTLREKLGWDS